MTGAARRLAAALMVAVLAVGAGPGPARAIGAGEALSDPAQEARARELFKRLRCVVCQNQSIDDSDADLARDLRIIVRERIKAGASDDDIIKFLTARYGDFVLLRPPVRPATWALWFGPFALLALGAAGIVIARRRRRAAAGPAPLTPEERARLARLLDGEGGESAR